MTAPRKLWRSEDGSRWFLLPAAVPLDCGEVVIQGLDGSTARVDARWLAMFEVDEAEARDWARKELGETLGSLKRSIDAGIGEARARLAEVRRKPARDDSRVTPDALPALFALLKSLPAVIGNSLSGRAERVEKAAGEAADLERRLRSAGLDLGERLSDFPARLAGLRAEFAKERARKRGP